MQYLTGVMESDILFGEDPTRDLEGLLPDYLYGMQKNKLKLIYVSSPGNACVVGIS